jgi:hypothetical protein
MNRRAFIRGSLAGAAGVRGVVPKLRGTQAGRAAATETASVPENPSEGPAAKGIRALSQHFNKSGGDISPWMFVPEENVKEVSTTASPGLVTIWPADKGKDIKGILKHPIRIDEYPTPWEFQLSMVQNFGAMAGIKPQSNYAIGLNIALTFSDPSTWPEDRTQLPPDTHTVQLLVIHLGSGSRGLAQYSHVPSPDTFLVWGRGDLHHTLMGDWEIPYVWIGDGASAAGPASNQLFFRFVVRGAGEEKQTSGVYGGESAAAFPRRNLSVGIKFDASYGWNMRDFDTSEFGKITGIWEIGPIISCDRWIPDVLCRSLPMLRGPHPIMLGGDPDPKHYWRNWVSVYAPKPEPPDPSFEQYVDYCVFMRSHPIPFEEMSDDFDIQGYRGQWVIQDQDTIIETYSNPGYMTWTLTGPSLATGIAPVGGDYMNLSVYKPPWEAEICFIAPDDTIPWNFFMNFAPVAKSGRHLTWHPGIQNLPKDRRHYYINSGFAQLGSAHAAGVFNVAFEKEIPESILGHKPLFMLIQWLDLSHVRVGFKAKREDPWYLSSVYDYSQVTHGEDLVDFAQMDWTTSTGRAWGGMDGCPMYQKFLIDYIHYRYGLSAT